MVIDSHGHVTAPDSLYVYKAQILAHRGAHGRGGNLAVERAMVKSLRAGPPIGQVMDRRYETMLKK